MAKMALLMVILKMLLPVCFGRQLLVLFKEFNEVGRILKTELVGDLAHVAVRIQQQPARFPHDKLIYHFAGALVCRFSTGGIQVLRGGIQLPGQHAHLPLNGWTGNQEVDQPGIQLRLHAGVKETMTPFFKQQRDQAFQEAVDAVMLIGSGGGGLSHQQREQDRQVTGVL